MVEKFKLYYLKLPENYQNIISGTILRMEKKHKKDSARKIFRIKDIIKFYRTKKNLTEKKFIEMCGDADVTFSENTYQSIIKRNVVNVKDNPTIKLISEILEIPTDKNGNLYIEYDIPKELQIGNIEKQKVSPLTSEYYSYLVEFQTNSVYDNFSCMSIEDQRAILYLAESLYQNQTSPELFVHSDTTDDLY